MLRFLDPEFIPNHEIMSSGKKRSDFWLISGWFVRYLAGSWMGWIVCGWFGQFGWFVGGFEYQ